MTAKAESAPARRAKEGSPWVGLWAVVAKEMADNLSSARMHILEILIVLTAVGTVYTSIQNIQNAANKSGFLFLLLFTTTKDPLPSFVSILSFLVPLIAISLSFDAINGEYNQHTLSRILSQPVYRDALLLGKFLAGFFTLALVLTATWLLIFGLGLIGLGIAPTVEEVARSLMFLLVTIFYGGIWLALGFVFSVIFRQPATSAMAAIAVWLFFTVFWNITAQIFGRALFPIQYGFAEEIINQVHATQWFSRISPNTLFAEAMVALLNPTIRSLGLILPTQMEGAIIGAPLPFSQSLALIWPHLTGLIAATILIFAVAYVLFQRQEIRA